MWGRTPEHSSYSKYLSLGQFFLLVKITPFSVRSHSETETQLQFWLMHTSEIKQHERKWILLLIKRSTAVGLLQAYYSSWAERIVEVKSCGKNHEHNYVHKSFSFQIFYFKIKSIIMYESFFPFACENISSFLLRNSPHKAMIKSIDVGKLHSKTAHSTCLVPVIWNQRFCDVL